MPVLNRRDASATWVANGGPVRTGCALTFTPTVAYSYEEPIAVLLEDGSGRRMVYSDATGAKKFSMTTSHHIGAVRSAAAVHGLPLYEIPHEEIRMLAAYR